MPCVGRSQLGILGTQPFAQFNDLPAESLTKSTQVVKIFNTRQRPGWTVPWQAPSYSIRDHKVCNCRWGFIDDSLCAFRLELLLELEDQPVESTSGWRAISWPPKSALFSMCWAGFQDLAHLSLQAGHFPAGISCHAHNIIIGKFHQIPTLISCLSLIILFHHRS